MSPCSKLRLLLTESETQQLNDSTAQNGACSRALLIAEALRAGLANPNQTVSQGKRNMAVDLWVPTRLFVAVKELAATHHVTQQSLYRLFLFQYLAAAPWEEHSEERKVEEVSFQ